MTLNKEQILAIEKAGLSSQEEVINILLNPIDKRQLSTDILLKSLKIANATYRAGYPIIDDEMYDNVYLSELVRREPNHPYLTSIEPEALQNEKTLKLPKRMLSTDKSYSFDDIKKWVKKLKNAANEIDVNLEELEIRVTPKLDGYAGYDDGLTLYTRGDGYKGKNITHAFERGLKVAAGGSRGEGPGEIVIKKSYFDEHLKEYFENSRNIQAAITAEKKIDKRIKKAIDDGACVFYPFSLLKNWTGNYKELLNNFEMIAEEVWNYVDFDIDGIILETTVEKLKEQLGSTRHHHRWQIAFKVNDEKAEVEVLEIIPQTSRTGKVTPVAELVPTKLSGALLSRATVHHFGMVRDKGIGPGAIIELVRSGLVIPKIERVIRKVTPIYPKHCLSCNSELGWEGDNLICLNTTSCPAQIEHTMGHFFKILGNVDGFGPKVITKLHEGGVKTINQIYKMTKGEFSTFGFGPKQSENLENELGKSRKIEIEDWRFLAAFGVTRMGLGNCEKILQHHDITSIFSLSIEDMVRIDGFAEITAKAIYDGLNSIKGDFFKIYELGFNLKGTLEKSSQIIDNPISGKLIVFTGSMEHGSRKDMEKQAKELGAQIGKSVTSKTSILVTGLKVGTTKINAAKEKGIEVLTEEEYIVLLS